MRLSYYKRLVHFCLIVSEAARDDDKFLYFLVCSQIGEDKHGSDFDYTKVTFVDVMKDKLFPAPETISRIRRKLQNQFPELAGKRKRERMERQAEFVQYAKSSVADEFGDHNNGTNG